jgi:hypothetical protein
LYTDPLQPVNTDEFYPGTHNNKPYWSKTIHTSPENLLFWIDFLDPGDAPLSKYSVKHITARTKVENVSGSANICVNKTPEVLFILNNETVQVDKNTNAYTQIWL